MEWAGREDRKWVRAFRCGAQGGVLQVANILKFGKHQNQIAAQLDTFKGEKTVGDKTCRGSKRRIQFTKAPCIESCKNRKAIDGIFDGNGWISHSTP